MRPILLTAFSLLVVTRGICEDSPGEASGANRQIEDRTRLKIRMEQALEQGDLGKQDEIDRFYKSSPRSWQADAQPLYEARYDTLRKSIGTKDEDRELDKIARICEYVRKTGVPSLFSKLEIDYSRANPYIFPEYLRMAGWPQPGDKHQLKGVQGQILATMVVVRGKDYIKELVSKTAALAQDSDEKLLKIWALGYSGLPEGSNYLKLVSVSGSDREKALAISALNYLVLQIRRHAEEGIEIDKELLGDDEKFLSDHGWARGVTAGEYYPL